MTEMDAAADRSALVPGVHRLIRTVDGKEGPFAGALVGYDEGVAVCVDAAEIAEWGGWAFSDAEHVCGVIDVRRRVDGQDALLPWCTQRVETFLGRRRAADAPLASGELGTLVVSLMRGVRELEHAEDAVGEWWLSGDGRPLFVLGDGGAARARTAALVERAAAHTADRATLRVLEEIATALRERRHHADDDARWEEQLLAVAAPRALRLDVFAPEKAGDLVPRRALRLEPDDDRRARRVRTRPSERRAVWSLLDRIRISAGERMHAVLSGLARLRRRTHAGMQTAGDEGRSTPRRRQRSHRRPLILAGSLAAIVLIAGLMWPEGQDPEPAGAAQTVRDAAPTAEDAWDTGTDGDAEAGESDEVEVTDEAEVEPAPSETDDPLRAVPVLLGMIAECAETVSDTCPDAVADGLAMPSEGLVVRGPDASAATLVDDYGDVAVVKLTPVDAESAEAGSNSAEQMLVLERREQKWLVRDVYDVAHQPN